MTQTTEKSARPFVSVPGKAVLIGEYAVLDGTRALVTAVSVRARIHAPRKRLGERPCEPTEVVEAARIVAQRVLAERGADASIAPVPCVETCAFAPGGRKLGVGSSAAVTVGVLAYHLAAAGEPLHQATLLELAREAHHRAQGGGSGIDVATAVHGGTLAYTLRDGKGEARPIQLPPDLHLAFFDAGAPASTASLLGQVQAGKARDERAYAGARAHLDAAAEAFFAAVAGDTVDLTGLRDAVVRHNRGLAALGDLAQAQILTPAIDTIIAEAEQLGLAAKPSGAGGGDLVVAFARDAATLDRLAQRLWQNHGVARLQGLGMDADGVRLDAHAPVVSRLTGFFQRGVEGRRELLRDVAHLDGDTFRGLDAGGFGLDAAEHMIENVIGTMALPVGVATNFQINGRDVLVPMCVEEASVVAAASNAAKMIRAGGGFVAHADPPWMIGQVQLVRPDGAERDAAAAAAAALAATSELLSIADASHPRLVGRGGGAREIEARVLADDTVAVHVLIDCRDAMGANLVNTVAEAIAEPLERHTGWRACLRILSNLADRRAAHVRCRVPAAVLAGKGWDGAEVVDRIVSASRFAELDPYRATTHNKGVMNGVDAVVLATGNDWRAMEAGAHAYAARDGRYAPLAVWRKGDDGALEGEISLPTAIGVVGGATRTHPAARAALRLLGDPDAATLGLVMASVGLASNLAALRALATEGIQRGHMSLHARSVALGAGASGSEIDELARRLVAVGEIKPERAASLLLEMRRGA